ncbi:hypothetical protein SOCE26_092250 [Sorangium cellulosum]|uniref:Uncharacterized protein n=1 Tax=Sorangium cellulosum TaxID=56 RepID=A0A2L0F884_SORCE|nr:DUF1552 domain-containing protein [Sorangium cellulosum]AUX47701.1 hypothetical protein SOCE26_092250 [Sorangium cellulosum]
MNRRTFLRGAGGVMLGLPFLESLRARDAKAGPADAPRRFIAFFMCNGVNMDRFFPATQYGALTDASFAEDRAIAPLAGYKDRLLIPRGIHMVPRGFGWDETAGDDHAKGMGCKLTAQPLVEGSQYPAGISLDQFIASKLNPPGKPALTLMVGAKVPNVRGHISYSGSEQPVTGENNPWRAYRDLVGVTDLDTEALERLTKRRQSVLDLVGPEYELLLAKRLSKADRDKLDMHFQRVRDLEVDMGNAGIVLPAERVAEIEGINPDTVSYDAEFKKIGRMQMDILALAIATGATRAATLQWGSGAFGPIFKWDGMSHLYNHHKLSHGNTEDDDSGSEVAGYEEMLFDIDRWFINEYVYLLDRLASYDEGGSSVLDNSAVVFMNELSHGKWHDFRDLPYVIAGSCGGYLKTGQYIKVTREADTVNDKDAPHNKLLTTLANAVGCTADDGGPVTNFGSFGQPGEFDDLKA